MLKIELGYLPQITDQKLINGLRFMRLMRDEGILPMDMGIHPIILGGAVRNGIFKNLPINDIDIFFYRQWIGNSRANRSSERDVNLLLNSILSFLEDQEITHTSRLSQRAAEYFGGNRFLDILEFEWENTTIQLMIPQGNDLSGLDGLFRSMPIYSAMGLTLVDLLITNPAYASMFLPEGVYPVGTDRDVPYLMNKFPEGRCVVWGTGEQAIASIFHDEMQQIPISSFTNGQIANQRANHMQTANKLVMSHAQRHFNLTIAPTPNGWYIPNASAYSTTH